MKILTRCVCLLDGNNLIDVRGKEFSFNTYTISHKIAIPENVKEKYLCKIMRLENSEWFFILKSDFFHHPRKQMMTVRRKISPHDRRSNICGEIRKYFQICIGEKKDFSSLLSIKNFLLLTRISKNKKKTLSEWLGKIDFSPFWPFHKYSHLLTHTHAQKIFPIRSLVRSWMKNRIYFWLFRF